MKYPSFLPAALALSCTVLFTAGSSMAQSSRLSLEKRTLLKMDAILIPEVKFRNVELGIVLDFLSKVSQERDPDDIGINLVDMSMAPGPDRKARPAPSAEPNNDFFFPPAPPKDAKPAVPRVTVNLRRVSMKDALEIICDMTGTEFYVKKNVVVVKRKGAVRGDAKPRVYRINDPARMNELLRKMQQGEKAPEDPFFRQDPFGR